MILIVTTSEHRSTHDRLQSERKIDVRVVSYDEVLKTRKPYRATYVFTDVDRLPAWRARQAALLYRRLAADGIRVLNDPARLASRFGLLRSLNRSGINMFDAYRVDELAEPRRWPVFLRVEGDHKAPVSALLHSPDELEQALEDCLASGHPRSALLIIEYAAEPVRDGLFRKLSVFRVGERLIGYTCTHDDNWLVKYGKTGIAPPELYEEEYGFVAQPPFADLMRRVFDLAGIDYGRVDFGLVAGKPQIYEINTNPHIDLRPEPSPVARRNQSVDAFRANYLAAIDAIDTNDRWASVVWAARTVLPRAALATRAMHWKARKAMRLVK